MASSAPAVRDGRRLRPDRPGEAASVVLADLDGGRAAAAAARVNRLAW
jgi:hypothetical protein